MVNINTINCISSEIEKQRRFCNTESGKNRERRVTRLLIFGPQSTRGGGKQYIFVYVDDFHGRPVTIYPLGPVILPPVTCILYASASLCNLAKVDFDSIIKREKRKCTGGGETNSNNDYTGAHLYIAIID